MSHESTASILLTMFGRVKRLGSLYVENLRLKSTEKITIILAAVAFYAVAMALGLVCLVFISIGIGHWMATTIAPHLAYLFIAAFYLVLFVLCILWRRQIFIDPIARFISRVLVEIPEEERQSLRTAPVPPTSSTAVATENDITDSDADNGIIIVEQDHINDTDDDDTDK
ncbi:MAG: phage holin family protein [Bacteroidales bacterium]|nr:phage holin family protein [Bacteroidales bacterium]